MRFALTSNTEHRISDRGIALLLVLWAMTLIGVLATSSASSMRQEVRAVSNFKEEAEAYYLAIGGVQRAMVELLNADRNEEPNSIQYDTWQETWKTNPEAYEDVPLGRGSYRVTVVDEESKLPLNRATPEALRRLFEASGVEGVALDTIVDSLQDWRDPDNFHRINGAEDDYYLSLPVPYRAKNGDFDSLEELLLVKGMTPEILYGSRGEGEKRYKGVVHALTVDGMGGVNINTAPAEVLSALGFNGSEVARILERRKEQPFRQQNEVRTILTNPSDFNRFLPLLQVRSSTFRVEATGKVEGSGIRRRVVAIFRKEGSPRFGSLLVIRWEDNAILTPSGHVWSFAPPA
ncbi:MAG: type II secretion system minor pseudopilin GspK [candidate division NC10 bacterium]|nr:type II secretion system minor pseudopilin GspK [candidate division NC10 bacterium]